MPHKFKDETGKTYGRLRVLGRGENIGWLAGWICQCRCGKLKTILGASLRNGNTRSCGCLYLATRRRKKWV